MENTVGQSFPSMGQISREKYWSELTIEEKVERTRLQIHKLSATLSEVKNLSENLGNKFCNHEHLNGKIMVDNKAIIVPVETRLKNPIKPDEVFF